MKTPQGALKKSQLCRDIWMYVVSPYFGVLDCERIRGVCRRFRLWFRPNEEWRALERRKNPYTCLLIAARQGDYGLVNLFIHCGSFDWNDALWFAACGGHRALLDLIIENGATNLNNALWGAGYGGHQALVDFLIIEHGVTDLNYALWGARQGGHRTLKTYLEEKMKSEEK